MLSNTEPWNKTGSCGGVLEDGAGGSKQLAYLLNKPDILPKPVEIQSVDGPPI
jgi:hypothetical protein